MAVDKSKNKQILITFPEDLVEEIESYWHRNSIVNRSEAIRQLIRVGLEKEGESDGE